MRLEIRSGSFLKSLAMGGAAAALIAHAAVAVPAEGGKRHEGECTPGLANAPVRHLWDQASRFTREMAGLKPQASEGGIAGLAATLISTNTAPEADGPDDVAYTPNGAQVVIAHRDTNNVTFMDVNTRAVVDTVAVGEFPTDVAVAPNGSFAVTPNIFSDNVSLINLTTHAVTTVPITGQQPYAVKITSDSHYAVVGVINDAVTSAFSIIDLTTQTEVASIPTTPQGVIGNFVFGQAAIVTPIFTFFAVSPNNDTIVLPFRGGDQVGLFSIAAEGSLNSIPVGTAPTAVTISNDGTTALTAHTGLVTRIDIASQAVTGTFTVANLDQLLIKITPDKSHAIGASAGLATNQTLFVNLATSAVDGTLATGTPGDIQISFNGTFAFVPTPTGASIINIATRTVVKAIAAPVGDEAACSPIALRAVALNSRAHEDIHFYNINGASGVLEGTSLTGVPPEGDASRNVAISPNGSRAVVCENTSRNVAIVNPQTLSLLGYVNVGENPLDVAITPDNQYAVVCAATANAVHVIDLNTNAIVKTITVPNAPVRVRINPSGTAAYVLGVAAPDSVSFITLAGAASALVTQTVSGNEGAATGYAFFEYSGIELNPAGTLLAVCDSFNDLLRLYDTTTHAQVAAVPVGDFPIRVAFNPAGTKAYVANAFGDSVSIVAISGATSSVLDTVGGIEFPLAVSVDATGTWVYVGNTDNTNPALNVINGATNAFEASIPLAAVARDSHYSAADNVLYLILNDATFVRVDAQGPAATIIDTTDLSAGSSDLAFCEATKTAVMAQPFPDGVDVLPINPPANCPADITGNNVVDIDDLFEVINNWAGGPGNPADITGNGIVDIDDLFEVINAWGPCP